MFSAVEKYLDSGLYQEKILVAAAQGAREEERKSWK